MNNHFRKRHAGPRLSPEEAKRQGRITTLAFSVFGRERAIAFLNTAHGKLGGRPLDIAIERNQGLTAVEQVVAAHATDA